MNKIAPANDDANPDTNIQDPRRALTLRHWPPGVQFDISQLRPQVLAFAWAIERKLRLNDHKEPWTECDPLWLLERALQEIETELRPALDGLDPRGEAGVLDESVDGAAFMLMIADLRGALQDVPLPALQP